MSSSAAVLVSVIIPNWNGAKLLPKCLSSLGAQSYQNFEIIVIDNGSHDTSVELIERNYPDIKLIKLKENTGFAFACNKGIEASKARYVVLLNTDTQARPTWLQALVGSMEQQPKEVACISSKMLNMANSLVMDDAGDYLTWRGAAFKRGNGQPADQFTRSQEIMLPCAGAALYRRAVLVEMDGFDDRFFAYLEDVDLGLRLRLSGYRCWYCAQAEILHVGHGSSIESGLYVFLTTRNRFFVFIKNIPLLLLLKHAPDIIYGWLFFLVVHRGKWMFWRGTFAVIKNIFYLYKQRQKQAQRTILTNTQIDQLLSNDWPEVSLRQLISREFKSDSSP